MHECARCAGSVGDAFRYCPWCAAPQRVKLVEFFRGHPLIEGSARMLRVSRYLDEHVTQRHVRFSIWDGRRADAAVSLSDAEADRLAGFLAHTAPQRRSRIKEIAERVSARIAG